MITFLIVIGSLVVAIVFAGIAWVFFFIFVSIIGTIWDVYTKWRIRKERDNAKD